MEPKRPQIVVKSSPANAGDIRDVGSIPGSGRSPGGGNGNLLQYSSLENPMDRGAWQGTVQRVTKSQTRLSNWTTTIHLLIHCNWFLEYESESLSQDICTSYSLCLKHSTLLYPLESQLQFHPLSKAFPNRPSKSASSQPPHNTLQNNTYLVFLMILTTVWNYLVNVHVPSYYTF